MAYIPNADVIAKQKVYDDAQARYMDWVSNNKNLGCYRSILSVSDVTVNKKSLSECDWNICGGGLLHQCNEEIKFINSDVIPALQRAYDDLQLAQNSDPNYKIEHDKEVQAAQAQAAATRQKYITIAIIVVVIGFLIFAYFKWIKK